MSKPVFTILAGSSGTGKTTLRERVNPSAFESIEIVTPDNYIGQYNHLSDAEARKKQQELAMSREAELMEARASFGIETLMASPKRIEQIQSIKASGYETHLIFIGLQSENLAVDRVFDRASDGGHFISEDQVRRGYQGAMNNLPRAVAIADRVDIYDNSGAGHIHLVEIVDKKADIKVEHLPEWLTSRFPQGIQHHLDQAAAQESAQQSEKTKKKGLGIGE